MTGRGLKRRNRGVLRNEYGSHCRRRPRSEVNARPKKEAFGGAGKLTHRNSVLRCVLSVKRTHSNKMIILG